jgi:peptide/nickel transport system permease protein
VSDAGSAENRIAALTGARQSRRRGPFGRFVRNRAAVIGATVLLAFILISIFAPVLTQINPSQQNLMQILASPSSEHWFGTDHLGRDIYTRVVYGGRVTLPVAFLGVFGAIIVGVPAGLFAGYRGGVVETLIMRGTDILLAFPAFLLAIAITSALGVALSTVSIAIAVFSTPVYVRLVRAETLRLKQREFVVAAQAIGASEPTIILKHILPNGLGPIIVQATLNSAVAIITVTGLSFLGLGAQPPTPEWGVMLADGRGYMQVAFHVTIFPGIAIFLVVLAFNLLGDGLRDAYDPRSAT